MVKATYKVSDLPESPNRAAMLVSTRMPAAPPSRENTPTIIELRNNCRLEDMGVLTGIRSRKTGGPQLFFRWHGKGASASFSSYHDHKLRPRRGAGCQSSVDLNSATISAKGTARVAARTAKKTRVPAPQISQRYRKFAPAVSG